MLSSPHLRMRRALAVVPPLLSTVLTLGALEVAARAWSDPSGGNADLLAFTGEARTSSVLIKSSDPGLIYVTRPGYVKDGIRISNGQGVLRPDDVPVHKPAGTFRIVVLGDSIAAGHPLRSGPTPPVGLQLETRLNAGAATPRIEVLTFAADGYGTSQEARLLETAAAPFEPDVVVLAYCLNDPTNSYTPTVWFLDNPGPRWYLLDLVRRRLGLTPSELSPAHPRYTHGAVDWPALYRRESAQWQSVERGLDSIAAFGRDRRVPVLTVLFPLLHTGEEPAVERAQAEGMYDQVRDAAARRGFAFLDLRDAFRGHTAAELRFLPGDPIHPGALGHSLAADAIAGALVSARLVPRAPAPAQP